MSDDKGKRRRPRQRRSKATVSAILEAAGQLFAEGGVSGLNTNRVAERAGVGVGSLYEYFANRDALVRGLVERFASEIDAEVNGVFDRGDGEHLDVMLPRLIHATVAVYDRDSELHARLLRRVPHIPGENPLDLIEEPIRRRFAAMVRACAAETDVGDPERAALVCVHAVRRMVDAACADPKLAISYPEVEAEMVAMTKRYLTGRP